MSPAFENLEHSLRRSGQVIMVLILFATSVANIWVTRSHLGNQVHLSLLCSVKVSCPLLSNDNCH